MNLVIKYFTDGHQVLLGDLGTFKAGGQTPKLICVAVSARLAQKIASFMNKDTRKGKAHEYFASGTGNPKRA